MKLALTTLWLLLITLDSYYFYQVGAPVFPLLAACMSVVFVIYNYRKVNFSEIIVNQKKVLFIFAYLAISSIVIGLFYQTAVFEKRIPALVFFLPIIIHAGYLFHSRPDLLKSGLKTVLSIHLLFFFVQFITYYATGNFLDYLEPITGESQRALGGSYTFSALNIKLIRATGLFNEPGSYSTFVFLTYAILQIVRKNLNEDLSITLFDGLVLMSILLTFSIFGFIFTSTYVATLLIHKKLSTKIAVAVMATPFMYLSVINYIMPRFGKDADHSGVGFRTEIVQYAIDHIPENTYATLIGYGSFVDLNTLFNVSFFWNDVGLILNLITSFGVVGMIILAFISREAFMKYKLFFIILLLAKLSIYTIFIWFCFSIFYSRATEQASGKVFPETS